MWTRPESKTLSVIRGAGASKARALWRRS
jgi:hypothetical protein